MVQAPINRLREVLAGLVFWILCFDQVVEVRDQRECAGQFLNEKALPHEDRAGHAELEIAAHQFGIIGLACDGGDCIKLRLQRRDLDLQAKPRLDRGSRYASDEVGQGQNNLKPAWRS